MKYANVLLGLPIEGPFTYLVPNRFSKDIEIGRRVIVPFGSRRMVGYVADFSSKAGTDKKIKEIEEVIDKERIISDELFKLTRWISSYYFCSWGEAIELTVPPMLRKPISKINKLKNEIPEKLNKSSQKPLKIKLDSYQTRLIKEIEENLINDRTETFLIYNSDNDDRLNIYLKASEISLRHNKSLIILVPQISHILQIESQLSEKFGRDKVISVHSHLSASQMYQGWHKIRSEKSCIAIGSRLAVFAPINNLKLIIVDEENDSAYKQIETPRYNAKDVAIKRAELNKATVILTSLTPSVESYYKAKLKQYKLIENKTPYQMPQIEIINMRKEHYKKQKAKPLISKLLESKTKDVLDSKEKIVLFLNRRGFSTFAYCSNCNMVIKCRNCHVSLKHHFNSRMLICHQCGYKTEVIDICPKCNVAYISYKGAGTQKLESEVNRLFPHANTLCADRDNVKKDIDIHYQKTDILIGTQIINRLKFNPAPALIGVISLDSLFNMPDFYASERAYHFLISLAVSVKKEGALFIQTYFPEHYVLQFIEKNQIDFYKNELIYRKDLDLPPYKHLCIITLKSANEDKLIAQADKIMNDLVENKPSGFDIIGPMPHPISKLRGKYQQNIVIKAKDPLLISKFLRNNLGGFTKSKIGNISLTVDVDPL